MMGIEETKVRKLDVLIATHGDDGLKRVGEMKLPEVDGVRYIVTWQSGSACRDTLPDGLLRDDIEIHVSNTTGLSNNRNAGIAAAKAPYCLIADNDLTYKPEGLRAVIEALDTHPETDVATFRHAGEPIHYPTETVDFTEQMPAGYNVTSFETAFRRDSIGKIRYDVNFGIGAPLACCEDPVFILDCRRAGLRCRFFPITIVEHKGYSTGYRPITDPRVAMAEGAYIRLAYGAGGYLRIPLFAWRAKRKGRMPLLWGICHLTRGFFSSYIAIHKSTFKEMQK
ncbi:MAG: glycosyltransferase family 2 protein [Muribaculaceae bacterium]|nr:glycosyltransferase family 2 protein [Muribaculaceae bacterium]